MKYKLGDSVVITDNTYIHSRYKVGDTGHIVEIRQDGYFTLKMYDDEHQLSFGGDFKKIEDSIVPISKKPFFPRKGQYYYMISWVGDVVLMTFVDDCVDRMAVEFGNFFETREEALKMSHKIKKLLEENKR